MTPQENWRPVPGYEGAYEVSDLGRVRSLPRIIMRANGIPQKIHGRMLKPYVANGYPTVRIAKGGDRGNGQTRLVHRLVAFAFLEPGPEGTEVCHIDGDKGNPRASNLYWGTRAENLADSIAHGTWNNQNVGKTHCIRGHEFTPANTYVWKTHRICRACNVIRERLRQQRRAA